MANDEEAPEGKPVDWERIILKFMEEQREAIADGLRNWGQGGIRRGRALYTIIAFMAGIVGGTGFLTVIGVLPGEALPSSWESFSCISSTFSARASKSHSDERVDLDPILKDMETA